MYHPLIQPNQQPSQSNPTQPPTTPRWASRAWPLFLLLPFAAIHAFFRETPDNHPRTFHSGRKSDFSTYFCTQTVCSIINPQSIPPPPLFHPSSCISKRFSCLLLLPCCDLMCLYTQFSPRTVFPHCVFLSRCQFPSPGVANLNAFVITHLKKKYFSKEKQFLNQFIYWILVYKRSFKGKIFI